MGNHEPFPDVELMLTGKGEDAGYLTPRGYCVTSTPPDLKTRLAAGYVIRVARVGGGESKNRTVDNPRVNIQVFALRSAAKPRDAHDGAELVRGDLMNLPAVTPWGRIDSAETESGPTAFPWPDAEITVSQCVYRLQTRR